MKVISLISETQSKSLLPLVSRYLVILILLFQYSTITSAQICSQEQLKEVLLKVNITPYSLQFYLSDNDNYILERVVCRNIKNEEIVANELHICEELDPCSNYFSKLTLRPVISNQTFEETCESKTAYIEPSTHIKEVEAFANSINLTWATSDGSCISKFVIVAKSPEKTFTNKFLNDQSFYLIEDLDSCQEYAIQLQTYVNDTEMIKNESISTSTKYSEPGNIELSINNLPSGQTRVTWDVSEHKTCIKNYTLKWYRLACTQKEAGTTIMRPEYSITTVYPSIKDECEWSETLSDQNIKQYDLNDLQGCEQYLLKVFINENGTSKAEQDFTSAEKIPTVVTKEDWSISATTIEMRWNAPKDHSKCVVFYCISVTGPNQKNQTLQNTSVDTFIVFEGMDPCGQYNVEIYPQSLNGSVGPSLHETFVMLEAQPTPINDPQVIEAEAYRLKISWLKPSFADLCIYGYQLSGWTDDNFAVEALSMATNETFVVYDKGLNSCKTYTIKIIPTTKTMHGEPMQFDVETSAIIVDSDKTTLQVVNTFPDSLELSAQSTDSNNTCQTIFAHFFCSTTADVLHTFAEKYVEGHVGDISFRATLSPLSAFTDYGCHVLLYNIAGPSNDKKIIHKTDPYFPEQPEEVALASKSYNSLTINWKQPKLPNGNIKLYILYLQRYEADYFVPPNCATEIMDSLSTQTANLEYNFLSLVPATKYSIQIAAQNEYGVGQYTPPRIFTTLPWISDPVENLETTIDGPYELEDTYQASVVVSWKIPCKSNGKIEHFNLQFIGQRFGHQTQTFSRTVLPKHDINGKVFHNETNLQPEYNYNVTVAVKTESIDSLSAFKRDQFDAPAGIPKRLNEDVIANTRVSAYETNHPTRSAIVRIPPDALDSDSGTILYMALLLSQKNCPENVTLEFGALDTNLYWPNVPSWREAYEESDICIRQYQTTPRKWNMANISNRSQKLRIDEEIVYTIGEDNCDDNSIQFCNGPLRADTDYNLVIRLFTKSGYNDAAVLEFKTDSAIKVTLILVSVSCCLLLAFLIGLLVLWVKKRMAWHRDSGQGIEDPFGNIIAKNFAVFYSDISKPEKIAREFKEISVVALELSYAASELGCHKNRYADIYPYDKNRVILDIDAEGSDYINASFIDGYTRKKEYIATQGPKPESTMDFWRMILQHNVRIIVMVTQFREGNQVKCHEYFPYSAKGVTVAIKLKESFDIYDRTEMSVSHEKYGLKQKVVHFYFKKWPDHGCPEDPMHLINFIQKIKAEKRPSYSPIVVHCSAGVGRTGTFIGLDIIMLRLKSESKINIFETVKKLRFQRMKMVQTVQQYSFLYACTFELVKHKIPRSALKYNKKLKKVSFKTNSITTAGTKDLNEEPTIMISTDQAERMYTTCHPLQNQPDLESSDDQPDKKTYSLDNSKIPM